MAAGRPQDSRILGGWAATNSRAAFQPSINVIGYVLLLLLCTINMRLLLLPPLLEAIVMLLAEPAATAAAAARMLFTTRSAGMMSHTCSGCDDTQDREW